MAEDNNRAERQKQDIQKLLSGQSITPPPTPSLSEDKKETSSAPLREDKLTLAVSFLSSPKVQSAEKSKKVAFLKQKGLNDAEIEEAFLRTATEQPVQKSVQQPAGQPAGQQQQQEKEQRNEGKETLPPIVPTRPPMTRPTQIVYYSQPPPERLDGMRLLAMALIYGVGAVGFTAGLVGIVKAFMSPLFNSIAGYQRERYNDRHEKLLRLNNILQEQLDEMPINNEKQEEEGKIMRHSSVWSPLLSEQKGLTDRLERLATLAQKHQRQDDPYSAFKATLSDLKGLLSRPEYSFSTYTPFSMYGSSFANRSNTGFDDTAVQGVKSEIRSFKGMLLSRRNFPTANVKSAAPPPSTPVPSGSTVSTAAATATTTTSTEATTATTATTTTSTSTPNATAAMVTSSPSTTVSQVSVNSSSSAPAFHPRQRQASMKAETQETKVAPTTVDATTPSSTKGKGTAIEDITESNE